MVLNLEMRWLHDLCAGPWIKRSGFERGSGNFFFSAKEFTLKITVSSQGNFQVLEGSDW